MGSPPSFSLRPATADDLPAIEAIERDVHRGTWTLEQFQTELEIPHALFWVVTDDETDGVVLGYLVARLLPDLPPSLHILSLVVSRSHQRLGWGKKMIHRAIDHAMQREAERCFLEVRKSNDRAIQFYQSLNFTITHLRRAFYADGEDAYVMDLPLQGANLEL